MGYQFRLENHEVKILTHKVRAHCWEWRLLNFFGHEIARGNGGRNREQARVAANKRKKRYFKHLRVWRMRLELRKKEKA